VIKGEAIFEEVRTEYFPKLKKVINAQIQEAQQIPNRMN